MKKLCYVIPEAEMILQNDNDVIRTSLVRYDDDGAVEARIVNWKA